MAKDKMPSKSEKVADAKGMKKAAKGKTAPAKSMPARGKMGGKPGKGAC